MPHTLQHDIRVGVCIISKFVLEKSTVYSMFHVTICVQDYCRPTLLLVQSKTVTNKPLLDLICQRDDGAGEAYPFQVIKNNFW